MEKKKEDCIICCLYLKVESTDGSDILVLYRYKIL